MPNAPLFSLILGRILVVGRKNVVEYGRIKQNKSPFEACSSEGLLLFLLALRPEVERHDHCDDGHHGVWLELGLQGQHCENDHDDQRHDGLYFQQCREVFQEIVQDINPP